MKGDNNEEEPSWYEVVESAKWKAWNKNRGMSRADAMDGFIKIGERVLQEQEYGWALVNPNPGPNYYDGCPNKAQFTTAQSLVMLI